MTTARIQALPAHVVEQIAAGEVVQRPVSVIKELIENSLDAGSTNIKVHYEPTKLVVHDNGCGIAKDDLGLAATRFATSKLTSVDDFDSLDSFGFRGEALSSMSLVARLEICTRTSSSSKPIAFVQTYQNGKPTLATPKVQARPVGTTVTVSDLFHNLPHRKKQIMSKKSEEYAKVLQCIERYAMQYPYVSFVCEKLFGKKLVVDFNSGALSAVKAATKESSEESVNTATKQVLCHVFGSQLRFVKVGAASEYMRLSGFCAEPGSGSASSRYFCLFCNHRLVESPDLKKQLEQLYSEFGKHKPACIFLSMNIDPKQVDVNVHPSKKVVTLLHQDVIYTEIIQAVKQALEKVGHAFIKQAVKTNTATIAPADDVKTNGENTSSKDISTSKKRPLEDVDPNDAAPAQPTSNTTTKMTRPIVNPYKKRIPSNQKIRTTTSAPAGALEPYLVVKQESAKTATPATETVGDHEGTCPLSKSLDLSQPGAFAVTCTCVSKVRTKRVVAVAIPKIKTSECNYKSIQSLRNKINKHVDVEQQQRLRKQAIYVGKVSPQGCLVQCGIELQLWNVEKLAQNLFYQMALQQFGGFVTAQLMDPIEVIQVVGQLLQFEDDLSNKRHDATTGTESEVLLQVNETNQDLANQVALCLLDRSEMLREYFCVGVERNDVQQVVLTTMPVLVTGHMPLPSGLPLFLLRLATEVSWTKEKACFHGIAKEFGLYYGSDNANLQHQIFPAVCQLYAPSKSDVQDCFQRLTQLTNLYKAFERG